MEQEWKEEQQRIKEAIQEKHEKEKELYLAVIAEKERWVGPL